MFITFFRRKFVIVQYFLGSGVSKLGGSLGVKFSDSAEKRCMKVTTSNTRNRDNVSRKI